MPIRPEDIQPNTSTDDKTVQIQEILKSSRIDTSKVYDRPPTILSILEQEGTSTTERRILTIGNFSVTKGKKKARKTFLNTLIAGTCASDTKIYSSLHPSLPDGKKNVAYFDTEQGEYDSFVTVQRIERIALDNKDRVAGYCLRPYSALERCDVIEQALKDDPCIGLAVIDGIRDLVTAINDELEASRIVNWLMRLTHDYKCHIIVVIHENKADQNSRGHIGTEIENRAEVCIAVKLIDGAWNSSEVECCFSRSIGFKNFTMTIDESGLPYVDDQFKKPLPEQKDYYEKQNLEPNEKFTDEEGLPF